MGKKKAPSYRVVIADARATRDGAYVDIVGHYNPLTDPTWFEVDDDKVRSWLSKGAQPTDRVEKLLANRGLLPVKDWGAPSREAAGRRAATGRSPPAAPVAEAAVEEPTAEAEAAAEAADEAPAETGEMLEAESNGHTDEEEAADAEAKPEA